MFVFVAPTANGKVVKHACMLQLQLSYPAQVAGGDAEGSPLAAQILQDLGHIRESGRAEILLVSFDEAAHGIARLGKLWPPLRLGHTGEREGIAKYADIRVAMCRDTFERKCATGECSE